ncbi:2-aminoethylphosphonate--pyruvate transaminase [Aquisphaera giovannonii]|uniref:2-aminoethylphosphonate--pyruvate transaminase n=1 Tax=Aquisphaera giovannonii TaxID=406548 RepID=A0A5B9W544_9BACT|nr:2-aminoethylphosphonate--pyruvate transaminase [Aquisphaera giovannonii]QEH35309.1 2-aminoethylphosphonate--pyruvate transaminase [Aquisphaera giovannonii]
MSDPAPTPPPAARDKLLFTPGPLTTSAGVKQAMLRDAGSWDVEFHEVVRGVRRSLLAVAGLSPDDGYDAIPMQGSGTFGVESAIGSAVPRGGKLLVLANGAYGERILRIAECMDLDRRVLRSDETAPPDAGAVDAALREDPAITHVALVHCETTTGILNPIAPVAGAVRRHGRSLILDAMSSFGAIPIDLKAEGIDYLVSSANKCIEGVPGFSFILARRAALEATGTRPRSHSLDLLGQLRALESTGQFRFTPPTHAILAFARALAELEAEGGPAGRGRRYLANHRALASGMGRLGFVPLLDPALQGPIITAFHHPADPAFRFADFYKGLSARGMIIYPGKLTKVDTFRIGNIGRLFEADMVQLVHAVEDTLRELGCGLPLAPP